MKEFQVFEFLERVNAPVTASASKWTVLMVFLQLKKFDAAIMMLGKIKKLNSIF
ncbi:hypothetical protein [Acinetobacter sp. CWB-B33]|uniref:hypothetical protein n=1 Tax=Acinetobacter sp. CWB-B33 TaxID=2815724 RepID=UPI0031FEF3B9